MAKIISRAFVAAFCVAALAIVGTSTRASEPVPGEGSWLEPSSKWQVDYGKSDCRLIRSFGTADDLVIIEVERQFSAHNYSWIFYGGAIPRLASSTRISIDVEPQDRVFRFESNPYLTPRYAKNMLGWFDTTGEMTQVILDSQRMAIVAQKKRVAAIKLTGARQALEALDRCHADLLKVWGIDPDRERLVKIRPEPANNAGAWATDDDYPKDDKRKGNEGITSFLLHVSVEGKVTGCQIVESSGFESLDMQTCKLMRQRGIFRPAKDAAGSPVASHYRNRVTWKLPQ